MLNHAAKLCYNIKLLTMFEFSKIAQRNMYKCHIENKTYGDNPK